MMVVGTVVVLALFLLVGWAVSLEMFQQRAWRRRVESGDLRIIAALIEEAMASWRRARPPKELRAATWAGVQGAQLVALTADGATVSATAEPEFRSEGGQRLQVTEALDEAVAIAARLVDMLLYDVPNLRLAYVRVDVYSSLVEDGQLVQRPILTTTAARAIAERLAWEEMTPAEILGRFQTRASGTGTPLRAIDVPAIEGASPGELREGAPAGAST
jgi:hypothetical protein